MQSRNFRIFNNTSSDTRNIPARRTDGRIYGWTDGRLECPLRLSLDKVTASICICKLVFRYNLLRNNQTPHKHQTQKQLQSMVDGDDSGGVELLYAGSSEPCRHAYLVARSFNTSITQC